MGRLDRVRRIATRRRLEIFGFVLGLGLIGLVLFRATRETSELRLSIGPAALSIVAFAASWLGLCVGWSALAHGRIQPRTMSIWTRTQMLRYIPGGVLAPASRFVELEGSHRHRARLLIAETAAILGAASFIGSVMATATIDRRWAIAAVGSAVPVVVSAVLAVRVGRSAKAICIWLIIVVSSLGAYAVGCAFSQRAVSDGVPFTMSAGAGLLSFVAGYLVVIAPSGAGAKEAAYVALLASHGASAVAAGALASRLTFIVGEIVVVIGVSLLARRSSRVRGEEPGRSDTGECPRIQSR